MDTNIPRRDFLRSTPAAALVLARAARGEGEAVVGPTAGEGRNALEPFDYHGVTLGASRWSAQYQEARDYYFSVPDDDILKGFRQAAGLPAPGQTLGGWCARNSNTVLGQWISGMARMYRATGDDAIRDKAIRLTEGFGATVGPDGDPRMTHYAYDKLVCGLVDLQRYGGYDEAGTLLRRVTDWAIESLDRTRAPATPALWFGRPNEWYTLAENLYRAYRLTGDERYRRFAEVWHYPQYWGKFTETSDPTDVHGVHAYSHTNTFSSAAMAYAVTGEPSYLTTLRNAYDFFQKRQCYATGGFGPIEHLMPSDGGLGRALEYRPDDFETVCGSWAGFKMTRYLTSFTGEARYGDWMERLFYNGVGAALHISEHGKNFYYSDYRVAGGSKQFKRETYTCCSGTYIQCMADYHNLVYYRDGSGLYVNLYVPSEVVWNGPGGEVRLAQETSYPAAETSTLTLKLAASQRFALKFRVPAWAEDVSLEVNGARATVPAAPGTWAALDREWRSGDRVQITIPLRFRMQSVDQQHPDRVAMVRGPVTYVLDAFAHSQTFRLPETDEELNQWLVPADEPGAFRMRIPGGRRVGSAIVPFYTMVESAPYKMYFDRKALPFEIW